MNNHLFRTSVALLGGLCLAAGLYAQAPKINFPAASPAATVTQRVGLTDIQINYNRPGAKGRKVFGGLVPYDHIWRTGANTATKISFSTPVKLNGTEVPAGTYELFTIPGVDEWTVIIHQNMSQWGAYAYDAKNDVARIKAKPTTLQSHLETLAIGVNDLRDESATLIIAWEKVRVDVTITVDVKSTLVPQIEAVMAAGGDKLPYASASMYYLENGLDLAKAAAWMDAAIAAQPDAFYLVYRKALILEKMGDKAGAIATAQKSIEGANLAPSPALKEEYLGLNQALMARLQ
ncbi:hypothetical protein Verru16b_00985 [Lacunisphaera limnophila]|uniref:DUF2911 domain-containing protein n=1 Tax=Lacunisphaera limnophila TaxID=1838286 RepID=A0A1D8ASQ7_9BACT|nr:DUF2911 domain-containing protein [Lacunisphaera limnophila]AOS43927.1 hypothetical protein Verru16b_00985 [Lacunisphaera limnophila]